MECPAVVDLAGILKAMMGLSASVYTTIYAVTVRPDALSFILFIAAAMLVPVLITFPVFNAVPFRQTNELSQPDHFWSNGADSGSVQGHCGSRAKFELPGCASPCTRLPRQRALTCRGPCLQEPDSQSHTLLSDSWACSCWWPPSLMTALC